MKLSYTLLIVLMTLALCSCTVTKTTTTYHEFTNEHQVGFDRELFEIDVKHQLDDQHMVVKMTNISESNYLFNWSRSALVINDTVIPFNQVPVYSKKLFTRQQSINRTTLFMGSSEIETNPNVNIPPEATYEILVLLQDQMNHLGIALKDTTKALSIETRFTFSELDGSNSYTNTYNFERQGVSSDKKNVPGYNTLQTVETYEQVSASETLKVFFTSTASAIIIIAGILGDE